MIRAFTISFDFEGKTYLALATARYGSEEGTVYTIHVHDDSLTRIVPQKHFSYSSKKPLCPLSLKQPRGLKLFTCINDAVVYHLQVCKDLH